MDMDLRPTLKRYVFLLFINQNCSGFKVTKVGKHFILVHSFKESDTIFK